MRRRGAPGVFLAVDEGDARVRKGEPAEVVDGGYVGGGCNVEGFAAVGGGVVEGDEAGDEREAVGDAGSCLEVSPSKKSVSRFSEERRRMEMTYCVHV